MYYCSINKFGLMTTQSVNRLMRDIDGQIEVNRDQTNKQTPNKQTNKQTIKQSINQSNKQTNKQLNIHVDRLDM